MLSGGMIWIIRGAVMNGFLKMWPLGLLLAVSACGLPPIVSAVSYAIEGASLAASGKGLTDHALSAAADRDCAMFRMIQGEEICRDNDPAFSGTALAMAGNDKPSESRGISTASRAAAPVLYSYGTTAAAPSSNWRIADRTDVSGNADARLPSTPETLISPNRAASGGRYPEIADQSDQVLVVSPGIELFALVQENGTLELFAYDNSRMDESDKLVLVASIAGYAEDPSVFAGINRDGGFVGIEDLIV